MVTERDEQIAVLCVHHAATNIETPRDGSPLSKDDFCFVELRRFIIAQARAQDDDTSTAIGSFCVADKNCVRLCKIASEQDVHQPGLAHGVDFRHVRYRWRQPTIRGDDTHAARPFGHQHAAVRQECERPWIDKSAGDGLDLEVTVGTGEHRISSARIVDNQEYDQRHNEPHTDLPACRFQLCGIAGSSDRAV